MRAVVPEGANDRHHERLDVDARTGERPCPFDDKNERYQRTGEQKVHEEPTLDVVLSNTAPLDAVYYATSLFFDERLDSGSDLR